MEAQNQPGDREKKVKDLIAGEQGRGFARIMPESEAYLAKLRARLARIRKPRTKHGLKKQPPSF